MHKLTSSATADAATIRTAGLDLVDIERLRLAYRRSGPEFLSRVFDEHELMAARNCPAPTWQVLGRMFGIKESVVKAAAGFPPDSGYRDISIEARSGQREWPVRVRGELAEWAGRQGVQLSGGGWMIHSGLGLAWTIGRPVARTSDPRQ